MKRASTILAMTLSVIAGCGGCKQSGAQSEDFITVDVTASYPKKELILQDFMDVEYIPLETTDEFICQGFVLAVGKDIILAKNWANDGDIFIFDRRTGKGLKKINRKGQSGEEYTNIQRIVLDEEKGEMFVDDHFIEKILVYDLDGNFKRSLKQEDNFSFPHVLNFGSENLICNNYWVTDKPPFTIISKQDGSLVKEIQIPFKEKISIDLYVTDKVNNMTYGASARTYNPIIPNFDSWILVEPSSDTLYRYSPDHTMVPLIARTPPVQSMNPEIFLFLSILTDRYYFMETVKKEFDFGTSSGFPATDLMYDRQKKAIFRYTVYNDDYSNKISVNMKSASVNDEIASWQNLEAHQLVAAREKGQLKGRLKEIAATLDEEDNPVIMLIKHRK
ncbi:MAG: 6-bladed beta-propeller [Tannerella sp.]|jgi:hypothetical protein|nr:6-bladed beta-propeller [Tannerella sp.]